MRTLVFVDVETTGLDVDRHEIVELAWAVEDGPVHVVRPRHTLRFAEPAALRVNRYHERGLDDRSRWSGPDEVSRFLLDARRATLVAANPSFDAAFLRAHFGYAPWHYRLFDIQAYAAGVLDRDTPDSLREICTALVECGHHIDDPDHSAGADVVALRQAHRALRRQRKALILESVNG